MRVIRLCCFHFQFSIFKSKRRDAGAQRKISAPPRRCGFKKKTGKFFKNAETRWRIYFSLRHRVSAFRIENGELKMKTTQPDHTHPIFPFGGRGALLSPLGVSGFFPLIKHHSYKKDKKITSDKVKKSTYVFKKNPRVDFSVQWILPSVLTDGQKLLGKIMGFSPPVDVAKASKGRKTILSVGFSQRQ
jgi:hypothetical protein